QLELTVDRPRRDAQLGGDLLGALALEPGQRDGPQGRVAQTAEEAIVVLGELRGVFGVRLPAEELRDPHGARAANVAPFDPRRLAEHMTPTALLPGPVPDRADHLPRRDRGENAPEVVAVGQLGELAPAGALAEAVEGTERDILLVELAAGPGGKPRMGPPRERSRIAGPGPPGGRRLRPPQGGEP